MDFLYFGNHHFNLIKLIKILKNICSLKVMKWDFIIISQYPLI